MQQIERSFGIVVAASIKWKVETGVGQFEVFTTLLLTFDF